MIKKNKTSHSSNPYYFQLLRYEDQELINVSENDPENWAINSTAIDAEELLDSDEDKPRASPRTILGVKEEIWRERTSKGVLNYEAKIEQNRQAFAKEEVALDIMTRAQAFSGTALPRKQKGKKGEVILLIFPIRLLQEQRRA